jgi:hypothetical protein
MIICELYTDLLTYYLTRSALYRIIMHFKSIFMKMEKATKAIGRTAKQMEGLNDRGDLI